MTQHRPGWIAVAILTSLACANGAKPEPAPESGPGRDLGIPDRNPLPRAAPSTHPAGKARPSANPELQAWRAPTPDASLAEQTPAREGDHATSSQRSSTQPQVIRAKTPEEALEEYAASVKARAASAPPSKVQRVPPNEAGPPSTR
jgi:hypothetical protein